MLFKDRLLLANCDSVMKRPEEELKKRFKIGLLFSEGIVLSTNILIDNNSMDNIFKDPVINQYLLSNEGHGKLVIRGRGLEANQPLIDLYHALPDNFIFSSFHGKLKSQLNTQEIKIILHRLQYIDKIIDHSQAIREPINNFSTNTLSEQLSIRSESYFKDFKAVNLELSILNYQHELQTIKSRSEAYSLTELYFANDNYSEQIKQELIDPTYNRMFVKGSEGFVQDNIKILSSLPTALIDSGITLRKHREKIELISYIWDSFNFISSLGSSSIADIVTDKALDYIESKLEEKGNAFLTRRNWFGMYDKLSTSLGVEV